MGERGGRAALMSLDMAERPVPSTSVRHRCSPTPSTAFVYVLIPASGLHHRNDIRGGCISQHNHETVLPDKLHRSSLVMPTRALKVLSDPPPTAPRASHDQRPAGLGIKIRVAQQDRLPQSCRSPRSIDYTVRSLPLRFRPEHADSRGWQEWLNISVKIWLNYFPITIIFGKLWLIS